MTMTPPSSEYWRRRFEQLNEALLAIGEEYMDELEDEYRWVLIHLKRDIAYFYERFAENNKVSLAAARRILDNRELEEFHWTVEEYIKKGRQNAVDQRWLKELENASTRIRLSRLQSLEYQIRQEIELLAAKKVVGMTEIAEEIVKEGYYKSIYEIQREFGISDAFDVLEPSAVEKIVSKPWAPDGKDFSQRIWEDKDRLVHELQKELTHSFIRGDSPDQAINNIARVMNVSKKNAGRLVMTESAYFASVSRLESYKRTGVKEYQILATLDLRTSEICQEMDGRVFKINEYEPGVTANPFHPWCRTTTAPYFEGNIKSRYMRDPLTGKGDQTQGYISYKDWYQQYVVDRYGQEQADIMRKKLKNESSDFEQYKKYQKTLGDDAPFKGFAEFQELKYNRPDEWELVKLDYSRRGRLINDPQLKLPNVETATIDDRKFTEYLFGGKNKDGLTKGQLITDKLGYDINNYKEFGRKILERGAIYPSRIKDAIDQGQRYETRAFFYSDSKVPVNVEIGWLVNKDKTHMTSVYITEVKKNEN